MPGHFPPFLRPQRHFTRSFASNTAHNERRSCNSADTAAKKKSSLDLTQKLEEKLAQYNASQNVFKSWFLELVSWTLSALCMGAIVGICLRINGQSMADHQRAVNCVNVLGKIASAALIVPTSEALGQLKWQWFHSSKAIWDFEIFDKASRGPWGAVLLLYRTKGRSLAALGALLIVLLLGIDTFFQQIIDYPDQWAREKSMSAQIPKVVTYKPVYHPAYQSGIEISSEDKALAVALRSYFFDNGTQPVLFGNGTRPDVPLACPTSSCTWPEYDTLAVCSSCQEVSHLLDVSYLCMNTTIDWSTQWVGTTNDSILPTGTVCGTFLNATTEKPILLTGYVANSTFNMSDEVLLMRTVPLTDFETKMPLYKHGTLSYKDIRYPLLDALIASVPHGYGSTPNYESPTVHECMLSWCVQTLKSTYEWGRYTEETTSTLFETPMPEDPWPWYTFDTALGPFIVYTHDFAFDLADFDDHFANKRTVYTIDNTTTANVMNVFDDIFPAFYTQLPTGDRSLRFKNYPGLAPIIREMEFNPWLAPNNVTEHMERLAKSVTNVMRSSDSKLMVEGEAYSMKSFISVTWEWLIFPFALLLLTIAFLGSTMVKTSKDTSTGVWKTSTMPTLMYGLPGDARDKLTAQATWNSSHSNTKKVRIRMLPNLGWRVSGQSLLRSPLLPVRKDQPPPGWI
jgi:hypothetical protein